MKKMRIANLLISNLCVVAVIGLTSCLRLTVNVNFPESAVQQATDSYVHDLYKQKEKGKPAKQESVPETEPSSEPSKTPPPKSSIFDLNLVSSVWAADSSQQLHMDSPKALKIRERLAKNVSEILIHKKSGVLGETNEGKVLIKEPDKLKKLLQKKVEKLVEEENAARAELYDELLVANHFAQSHLINIKKSFGRSFQAESPVGTWIQDEEGNWSQKE